MKIDLLKTEKSVHQNDIKIFSNSLTHLKTFYLIGGVHGDEPEGVFLATQLLKEFEQIGEVSFNIIAIPLLNPDGIKVNTRKNGNGVDLNRNFQSSCWIETETDHKYHGGKKGIIEPENQILINLFQHYPPTLVLSIHAWHPFVNCPREIEHIGKKMANIASMKLVIDEIEGHQTPGSLEHYLKEFFNAPVITFEVQEGENLETLWSKSKESLVSLLNFFSTEP